MENVGKCFFFFFFFFLAKTIVVDRKKKQNALTLLYLASGLLPNAANSSDVSAEFAAEHNKEAKS